MRKSSSSSSCNALAVYPWSHNVSWCQPESKENGAKIECLWSAILCHVTAGSAAVEGGAASLFLERSLVLSACGRGVSELLSVPVTRLRV